MAYNKSFSLKTWNMVIMLLTVLFTALLIHFPWYFVSKNNIENITSKVNKEVSISVSQEVNNLFNNAEVTLNSIKDIIENRVVLLEDKEKIKSFFLSILSSNKNFSWVSFGSLDGDFLGAQRQSDTSLRFIDSDWIEEKNTALRVIDFYKLENDKLNFDISRIQEKKYYAPQRGWFKKAVDNKGLVWTDVYVFATSKKPGINVAISVEIDGEFVGVLTIALELERVSNYLKTIEVGKTGEVFIINTKSELVALKDSKEIAFNAVGDKARLRKVSESNLEFTSLSSRIIEQESINLQNLKLKEAITFYDSVTDEKYFANFMPIEKQGWIVVTIIPESDFLGTINENNQKMYYTITVLLILAIFASIFLTKKVIVTPLSNINTHTDNIKHFDLDKITYIPSIIKEVDALSQSIEGMKSGLSSFQKYLPVDLVRTLISKGIEAKLGGEEKEVSIFFSDLVDFTKISEELGSSLIPHMSEYLQSMSEEIMHQDGTIDKYIGDSIMAFWGAPNPNKYHALDACRSAINCQKELKALRFKWKREGKPLFFTRIGINTGKVLVGNMGSIDKMNYTIIGDSVNVASRLEALNKEYGTDILIGEQTYEQVKDDVIVRKIDRVKVYGKDWAIDVYELLEMKDQVSSFDRFNWIDTYEDALKLYQDAKFEEAIIKFKQVIEVKREDDRPSLVFIQKSLDYLKLNTPESFDGITVMDRK